MAEKKKVLVADDDQGINLLLVNTLLKKFDVHSSFSGKETLSKCEEHHFDLVLLDVNLGDIDGREVCKTLKNDSEGKPPLIIFISGDQDQENIIRCFENGADDFIGKPFSPVQVMTKVEALLKYDVMIDNLQSQSQELTSLVTTTMSQASSYGSSLQMVKQLNHANSESEIAQTVFNFLASQGLHAALYLKDNKHSTCFDQASSVCSPIVKEVFELTHNKQRIKNLGTRLMVSDQHCSILVLDPPKEDEEAYGIFIDIITVVIEAVEARFIGFLREQELRSLNKELSLVISQINQDVEQVRKDKQSLMDDIIMQIGLSFHKLDLTIDQEEYFTKLMEQTLLSHDENNNVLMTLQERLQTLVNEMKTLLT
ncbi:response regulator [Psychrosphaera haliotis]|uniref:Response regulator n=1 Tax=Psychrosphaera haliotis TaxID=555083 RepID=A0A6N8FAW5_9GAMM|nr:response regulator transcription factor [Psychrosphaera haliotis]MUH72140.1 response regulator [Psychrosphaera haliotis]